MSQCYAGYSSISNLNKSTRMLTNVNVHEYSPSPHIPPLLSHCLDPPPPRNHHNNDAHRCHHGAFVVAEVRLSKCPSCSSSQGCRHHRRRCHRVVFVPRAAAANVTMIGSTAWRQALRIVRSAHLEHAIKLIRHPARRSKRPPSPARATNDPSSSSTPLLDRESARQSLPSPTLSRAYE